MLAVAVMHLHHVIEGRVEEGELSKHHCGGDMGWRSQWGSPRGHAGGKEWRSVRPQVRKRETSEEVVGSWG